MFIFAYHKETCSDEVFDVILGKLGEQPAQGQCHHTAATTNSSPLNPLLHRRRQQHLHPDPYRRVHCPP